MNKKIVLGLAAGAATLGATVTTAILVRKDKKIASKITASLAGAAAVVAVAFGASAVAGDIMENDENNESNEYNEIEHHYTKSFDDNENDEHNEIEYHYTKSFDDNENDEINDGENDEIDNVIYNELWRNQEHNGKEGIEQAE